MNETEFKEVFLAGYRQGVTDKWMIDNGQLEIGSQGSMASAKAWNSYKKEQDQEK